MASDDKDAALARSSPDEAEGSPSATSHFVVRETVVPLECSGVQSAVSECA